MSYPFTKTAASAAVIFILAAPAAAQNSSALCKATLDSLSALSGAPGDTFEMRGVWDETQDARTASINKGNGRLLEVLSWNASIIKVRIPDGLSPGLYKVGVYCNNPPHWQGSGFKNFVVMARADGKPDQAALSLPQNTAGTAPPVQPQQSQTATQADAGGQTQIALREVSENPAPSAQMTEQSEPGEKNDGLRLGIIAIILAAVIIFIIRKRSVVRAANYQQAAEVPEQKPYTSNPKVRKFAGRDLPASFTGEYKGVKYSAEVLGFNMDKNGPAGGTPCVTISIDAPKALSQELEVNARTARPAVSGDRAAHINALLDMGADYIDIGFNTAQVAAEVPVTKAVVDRALAEKIVEQLIKLRELST